MINESKIRIILRHSEGLRTSDGRMSVLAFEIAGEDGVFHPAAARIDGTGIILHSPEVAHPVAIRYAWENAPVVNLVNAAGLPCVPFRRQLVSR
ncbi:MAG TPA: hypothetical protein PKI32_07485, partial [Opitutales bacterium]|nr:hypothetical protein [Opitutales bacterium]